MATTGKVRCSKCGIESAATAELCDYCGASLHGAQDASTPAVEEPAAAAPGIGFPVPAMPFVGAVNSAGTSLTRRYTDAYAVSRTVIDLGSWVKVLGYVIGGVIALLGLVSAGQSQSSLGVIVLLSGLFSGAVTAASFFVAGVLVSALGQALAATLDTAVNTSPLLSQDEMRQIMSVG